METRANYALIGVFTLAVIAAAFLFVYWFSGGDTGEGRQAVRVVFSGSVSGLSQGLGRDLQRHPRRRGDEAATLRRPAPGRRRDRGRPRRPRSAPTPARRLELQGLTGVATIGARRRRRRRPPLPAPPGPVAPDDLRRPLRLPGPHGERRATSPAGPTRCSSGSARSSPTTKARSTARSPTPSASRAR